MGNDIPKNSINNYKDTPKINNCNMASTDNKISRIKLLASATAGFTVSTISHTLIDSHLRARSVRKYILPLLGVASISAITGIIASRNIKSIHVADGNVRFQA